MMPNSMDPTRQGKQRPNDFSLKTERLTIFRLFLLFRRRRVRRLARYRTEEKKTNRDTLVDFSLCVPFERILGIRA